MMNDKAWTQAVEDLGPRLLRYFSGQFACQVAADLTQETLIRLVRKVQGGSLDPRKGSLRMFAFGIARFVRMEQKPEIWADPDPALPDPASSAESQLLEEERRRWLRHALARLPEAQRDVVLLQIDRELSLDDIAALTRLPLNTVKSHIHRAKEELRRLHQEESQYETH